MKRRGWVAGAVIALAALAAYQGALMAPFVFDDVASITGNPSLGSFWTAWWPPAGLTVSGRPVVNLTLALNRTLGGETVWGYHAFNLAVHVAAALVLFGLVRRTLRRQGREDRLAAGLGLTAAGLWALHPLQTEAVTYVVQRAESLMGLFYLVTLYGFVRAVEVEKPGRWQAVSVAACALGMATKEVMVSAPLLVLLYDRLWVAGSFRTALRMRKRYYMGLAATWLLLGALVTLAGNRAATAGVGAGVPVGAYAITQCAAVVHYLRLAVWPVPLVFDYGVPLVRGFAAVWPQALLLAIGAGATLWGLRRGSKWSYLGAWFFAMLAPSSSVVPVATQTMAEHRMYLPLAALVVAGVLGAYAWLGRRAWTVAIAVAALWSAFTMQRNADYADDERLWRLTVAQRPDNARAQTNLGYVLSVRGRYAEATEHYGRAVQLAPGKPDAYNNLGHDLVELGRAAEAAPILAEAVRLKPTYAEAHYNLAEALMRLGRFAEAAEHYRTAQRLGLDLTELPAQLGRALVHAGRPAEAVTACEEAARRRPEDAAVQNDLGIALAQTGRAAEAETHFVRAIGLKADFADARANLGSMQLAAGRTEEAMATFREVLRLKPDHAAAHNNLGEALARSGRAAEAVAEFEAALRIAPDYEAARKNLARVRK